jgi:hypothetical protein
MRAGDGEWHIADVRTPSGLVLEFQHSAIKPTERSARAWGALLKTGSVRLSSS